MGRNIFYAVLFFVFASAFGKISPADAAGTVSLARTGQTVSYAAGDDGAQQMGVAWPAPRFAVSGDCVTDNLTGLIWAKNANLNGGPQTWDSAVDLAKGQTLCGRSDWRLPNVNELESLISASASVPADWLTPATAAAAALS